MPQEIISQNQIRTASTTSTASTILSRGSSSESDLSLRPFYKGRKGIRNPYSNQCSYISQMIIMAHTGLVIPLKPSLPQNEKEKMRIQNEVEEENGIKQAKIAEKQIELSQLRLKIKSLEDNINSIETEIKTIQDTMNTLAERLRRLRENALIKIIQDTMNTLAERLDSLRENTAEQEIVGDNMVSCHRKRHELYDKRLEINYELNKVRDQISNITSDIESINLKSEKQLALEEYNRIVHANLSLEILRGNIKNGDVTPNDAESISQEFFYLVAPSHNPYIPGRQCFNWSFLSFDYDMEAFQDRLKKAFFENDWRVIVAGGNGHFFTYVRDSNGKTVTEINDHRVRFSINIQGLYEYYKNPEVWRGARSREIEFF